MSITLFTKLATIMLYYKKTEIAKLYGVNPRTISRWINDTKRDRLKLELQEVDGKSYIIKSAKNQRIMSELAQDRRKYLNKQNLKVVSPSEDFFKIYTEEQIIEIISGIETYREIPLKFSYFNSGATSWDEYTNELYKNTGVNTLKSTIELLDNNMGYIDYLLKSYDQVNVVDVGVGNALPTKNLLTHLVKQGKLNRYIAVDISNEMLLIAQKNIRRWFGNQVHFEGYVNDISFEPFADVIAEPPKGAINLVLLLGGTLANLEAPEDALKVIRKSMNRDDLFIYTRKLDSPSTREQFSAINEKAIELCEHTLDLLGIKDSLYNIELSYSNKERARLMSIRLKQAVTIELKLSRGTWKVELNKADTITVWRASQDNQFEIENQIYTNGFNPLQKSQTPDHNYMLLISDLRRRGREV